MGLEKLALIGLSAVLHASWNLLAKRSSDKQAFLWLMMVASVGLLLLPVAYLRPPVPRCGWGWVGLSGTLEAVYVILLGNAYQEGDLSAVYPVARGTAPVWATLIAYLFAGETVSPLGAIGILAVGAGVYLTNLGPALRSRPNGFLPSNGKAFRLSVLTGLTIAGYSVVDRTGVQVINPIAYLCLVFATASFLVAPHILASRARRAAEEWRRSGLRVLAVAAMSAAAYLLVLLVMRTTVVGYVASIREVSVVFAALLGTIVLREPFGRWKVLGSSVIFAGIMVIAIAG